MEILKIENFNDIKKIILTLKSDLYGNHTDTELEKLSKKYSEYGYFLLIKDNNDYLGYVAFYCNDTLKKIAYISMIVIKSKYQRKGYGSLLLNKVKEISLAKKMKSIKLEVAKTNSKAISLYKKMNYKIIEENEKSYYCLNKIDE